MRKSRKIKAFTLIELLAIIVILAIIAVITVPIILNIIENSRKGAAIDSAYGYRDAVNQYYISELTKIGEKDLDGFFNLNSNGELLNGSNPVSTVIPFTGKAPEGGSVVLDEGTLEAACLTIGDYKVTMIGGEVYSTEKGKCNGIEVYLNPTSEDGNPSCTEEEYNNNDKKLEKEGCMKWYVYDVSDNGYTMILDHNTTATIDGWISESDYNNAENIESTYGVTYLNNSFPSGEYNAGTDENGNSTGGNNNKGPLTALRVLKEDTEGWTIQNRTDSYTATIDAIGNGYTINYEDYKAKLISAEEVNSIVRNGNWDTSKEWYYLDGAYSTSDTNGKWQTKVANSQGASNYAWLFNNLNGCENSGCDTDLSIEKENGYWTSTPRIDVSNHVWGVYNIGTLYCRYLNDSTRGIRPVITVKKSDIVS